MRKWVCMIAKKQTIKWICAEKNLLALAHGTFWWKEIRLCILRCKCIKCHSILCIRFGPKSKWKRCKRNARLSFMNECVCNKQLLNNIGAMRWNWFIIIGPLHSVLSCLFCWLLPKWKISLLTNRSLLDHRHQPKSSSIAACPFLALAFLPFSFDCHYRSGLVPSPPHFTNRCPHIHNIRTYAAFKWIDGQPSNEWMNESTLVLPSGQWPVFAGAARCFPQRNVSHTSRCC